MVALKGINKVMSQGNLGLNPAVINRYDLLTSDLSVLCEPLSTSFEVFVCVRVRFQQPPGAPGPEVPPQPPHLVLQVC